MQREIMWLCEEAGSETLAAIVNQVCGLTSCSSGSDARYEMAEAIEGLRRLDYMELCYFCPPPDPGTVRERHCSALQNLRILDQLKISETGRWTTQRPEWLEVDQWLELCLTDEGYAALTS